MWTEVWTGAWASRRGRARRTSKIRACEAHGVALHLTRRHGRRILCVQKERHRPSTPPATDEQIVSGDAWGPILKQMWVFCPFTPYEKFAHIRPGGELWSAFRFVSVLLKSQDCGKMVSVLFGTFSVLSISVRKKLGRSMSSNQGGKGVWGFLVFGKETSFFLLVPTTSYFPRVIKNEGPSLSLRLSTATRTLVPRPFP